MSSAARRPASLMSVNDALPTETPEPTPEPGKPASRSARRQARAEPQEPVGGRARPKTGKSEQTRALILETAMRLFRERGYDKTTMRAIAAEAGVSVGNAYYYFEGKEALIQAFYARSQAEQLEAAESVFARETGLEERLRGVLRAVVTAMQPYRQVAGSIFRVASDP